MNHVHICCFEECPPVTSKTTYEDFRAAVLRAGRFSVFEATVTRRAAKMFDRLCRDPWIDTDISCGYPWTKVSARAEPKPEHIGVFGCMMCDAEWSKGKPLPCDHRMWQWLRDVPIPSTESEPTGGPHA